VHEPAKLINPFFKYDEVSYFSVEDIAAMNLHTICGRGKKKDFFDIYALLQNYTWSDLINIFKLKYEEDQLYFLWKSIQYFDDAENDPDINGIPPFTKSWAEIKEFIKEKTSK
jgi:predicted nucleotidyltransferase component of viral defense system